MFKHISQIPPKAPKPAKVVDSKGFSTPKVSLKPPKVIKFDRVDAVINMLSELVVDFNDLLIEEEANLSERSI